MAGLLAPYGIQAFYDNTGKPLAGGLLTSTLAGTATPSPLYPGAPLQIPLQDPVILDAGGRPASGTGQPQELWMDSALAYKFVLAAADGTVLQTVDNITSATVMPITPISTTGGPLSVATSAAPISLLLLSNASPLSLSGVTGGQVGQVLIIRSTTNVSVTLTHNNGALAVNDRFNNFATLASSYLFNGAAIYQHGPAGQGWNMIAHEQGGALAWTPTVNFGGAAVGLTYTNQSGAIWLQGVTVWGTLRVQLATKGTSTGFFAIANFPYQHAGSGINGAFASYGINWTSLVGRIGAYFAGAAFVNLTQTAPTGVGIITDANATNVSDVILNFRYQTS